MSAMSLILLSSLSPRLTTELSFMARSTCVCGIRMLVPNSLVVMLSFWVKTRESKGSSMGTNPSIALILGCM